VARGRGKRGQIERLEKKDEKGRSASQETKSLYVRLPRGRRGEKSRPNNTQRGRRSRAKNHKSSKAYCHKSGNTYFRLGEGEKRGTAPLSCSDPSKDIIVDCFHRQDIVVEKKTEGTVPKK